MIGMMLEVYKVLTDQDLKTLIRIPSADPQHSNPFRGAPHSRCHSTGSQGIGQSTLSERELELVPTWPQKLATDGRFLVLENTRKQFED